MRVNLHKRPFAGGSALRRRKSKKRHCAAKSVKFRTATISAKVASCPTSHPPTTASAAGFADRTPRRSSALQARNFFPARWHRGAASAPATDGRQDRISPNESAEAPWLAAVRRFAQSAQGKHGSVPNSRRMRRFRASRDQIRRIFERSLHNARRIRYRLRKIPKSLAFVRPKSPKAWGYCCLASAR